MDMIWNRNRSRAGSQTVISCWKSWFAFQTGADRRLQLCQMLSEGNDRVSGHEAEKWDDQRGVSLIDLSSI